MPKKSLEIILIADDDPDDRMLLRDAWEENRLPQQLRFVEDGEELLDYLRGRGRYAPPADAPVPDLLILDLNMPRMDGREALREIKADPLLRRLPVIVLTTSRMAEDVNVTYDLGISGFITKPVTFEGLVKVVEAIKNYWLDTLLLPPRDDL